MGKKKIIKIQKYKCSKCQHEWVPRKAEMPAVCPKCKSPRWNR